jgi:hypothetical protein
VPVKRGFYGDDLHAGSIVPVPKFFPLWKG